MRKQIKKAIATVLTATMIMSIALPAFAANEGNIANETELISQLDYDAVQALKEKYNLTPCDEQTVREILDEIVSLTKTNVDGEGYISINAVDTETTSDSRLNDLPVAKLSETDINALFADSGISTYSRPIAPDELNGVDFYAMYRTCPVLGVNYDVVQIVAYSTNMDSPLSATKNINLINSASYTVSQLNKTISAVCGVASNLQNLAVLSLGSYIADLANYCGSSSNQELTVTAGASQIMCYAYVNTGTLPYDLMLTTQRININDHYVLKSIRNGIIQTDKSFDVEGYAESDYYSDLIHAAEHYATNPATREEHYAGTSVKYYYDGVLKNQLGINVYPSPESIPPGFSV